MHPLSKSVVVSDATTDDKEIQHPKRKRKANHVGPAVSVGKRKVRHSMLLNADEYDLTREQPARQFNVFEHRCTKIPTDVIAKFDTDDHGHKEQLSSHPSYHTPKKSRVTRVSENESPLALRTPGGTDYVRAISITARSNARESKIGLFQTEASAKESVKKRVRRLSDAYVQKILSNIDYPDQVVVEADVDVTVKRGSRGNPAKAHGNLRADDISGVASYESDQSVPRDSDLETSSQASSGQDTFEVNDTNTVEEDAYEFCHLLAHSLGGTVTVVAPYNRNSLHMIVEKAVSDAMRKFKVNLHQHSSAQLLRGAPVSKSETMTWSLGTGSGEASVSFHFSQPVKPARQLISFVSTIVRHTIFKDMPSPVKRKPFAPKLQPSAAPVPMNKL